MAIITSTRWKRISWRRSPSFSALIRPWVSAECRYTTCGITVAPRMPTAIRTDSVPSKCGTIPLTNAGASTPTCSRS